MRVMGLDPSTCFGVAVVDAGKQVAFTEEIQFKKLEGYERIQAIGMRVLELHQELSPDLVAIEGMFVGHPSSAVTVISIAFFTRYLLWQEGIPFVDVPPTVLKKFVSGTGNATKDKMMMEVLRRWGYVSKTNNIADAVGIAMMGQCCIGEQFDVPSRALAAKVMEGATKEARDHVAQLRVSS